MQPHQGLAITNLHPSDQVSTEEPIQSFLSVGLYRSRPPHQGMYVCSASNKAGSVTASAMLRVQEPPVISVKPVAHYQVK